jgi:PTS system fructose-specific IIC component/PTS system nitrogen regulatory IIA component
MHLQDILLPKFIKVDMEADEKINAVEELTDFYCKADKSKAKDEILTAILTREAKMSTGIKRGIAIPHGKINAVKDVRCVLGISGKGVNYDSFDGEPVNIIFMIISPSEDSQEYLHLLKHIAELVYIQKFRDELLAQEDPQGVYEVICRFEEKFSDKIANSK